MRYQVYCDESCLAERFMALSAIIIPASNLAKFNASMAEFRSEQNMHSELKWSKISNQKVSEYRRFIDYFFDLNTTRKAHFHSLIIDTHQPKHRVFNEGD